MSAGAAPRMAAIGLACVIALPGAAFAHHSFGRYNMDTTLELTGVVTSFEYTNPHSWTRINVPDGEGGLVEWSFEGAGPGTMSRLGWNKNVIKVGQEITVFTHPMRDGSPEGTFEKAILADGRIIHHIDLLPGNPSYTSENVDEQERFAAGDPVYAFALAENGAPVESALYENTLHVETPNGPVNVWFDPDKSLTAVFNEAVYRGTWELDNGELCHVVLEPAPEDGQEPQRFCHPNGLIKDVGDTWEDGEDVFTIIAGREDKP